MYYPVIQIIICVLNVNMIKKMTKEKNLKIFNS